jgi:uncharacterized coiled-coil protein SlyX
MTEEKDNDFTNRLIRLTDKLTALETDMQLQHVVIASQDAVIASQSETIATQNEALVDLREAFDLYRRLFGSPPVSGPLQKLEQTIFGEEHESLHKSHDPNA